MNISRKNSNFMRKKFGLFMVLLLCLVMLAACQNEETQPDDTEENNTPPETNEETQPEPLNVTGEDISFQIDGEDIPSATVSECLALNNCSEDSTLHSKSVNGVELTEDIEPIEVTSADPVIINIEGEEPTNLSYTVYEEEDSGVSIQTETIDNNEFSLNG